MISPPDGCLWLLLRTKIRMLANRFDQSARQAPIKLVTTLIVVLLIWYGLYRLFWEALNFIHYGRLEAIVAVPVIFQFFFVALAVMLAFSNAIIAYGGLFGRGEAAYLLAAPVHPRDIVTLKFLESLFFASWSLVLLGLPLMAAMAAQKQAAASWAFYAFFTGFFASFVPIPAALGLVAAWATARYFPRSRLRVLMLAGFLLAGAAGYYAARIASQTADDSALWIKRFFDQMAPLQHALLPNQWIAAGIMAAAEGEYGSAGFYLFVLSANALFLSWVAVEVVSRRLTPAFARAQSAGGHALLGTAGRGLLTRAAEAPFFYLPRSLRLFARKDIRCFLRDPVQWSQMAILLGLLALYVSNVGRLSGGGGGSRDWVHLVSFLNLTTVTLILATFTSRFVYPLVSLEGQQFWVLDLLPIRRDRILWGKFAYAATVTVAAGLVVTILSIRSLETEPALAAAQIAAVTSICIGLCGTAVGFGACWPMFHQRNPARIASGFGGTVNLIVSVMLATITLGAIAVGGVLARTDDGEIRWSVAGLFLAGACVFDVIAGGTVLAVGIRRFRRVEF